MGLSVVLNINGNNIFNILTINSSFNVFKLQSQIFYEKYAKNH